MARPVRVLLVDDHEMVSEALAAALATRPDVWVVGRCTTEDRDVTGLVRLLRPDVVTVDVSPPQDPATLVNRFCAAWPQTSVVVLTGSRRADGAVAAARAGATGWVSKQSSLDTVVEVLRCASRGQASFPPDRLGAVLRELREDVRRAHRRGGPLDALTHRERAVLAGLARGYSTVRIAAELGLSPHTVRTHTGKILSKLGVHSRLEAVSLARTAGLGRSG